MVRYTINCEIIVEIDAKNIDVAEKEIEKRFNTKDTKFYQTIQYKEVV